jgi:serine phosphatase RsbU (regulator of sigma subunit)
MPSAIQSDAYQLAARKSERDRTLGLLIVIAGFILLDGGRGIAGLFTGGSVSRFAEYTVFWLACGGYELVMLWLANRALRLQRPMRRWIPVVNTVVECFFPTIAAFGQTVDKSYLGPYLALASGVLIIYCFFIILSTLRLSPALCILAGIVSSAGYSVAYLFTLWRAPHNPQRAVFKPDVFIINALLLLAAGLIAAAVARQIRQHVMAALTEAETKRKLATIEHDLQIARTIQMGLLPKSAPQVAGYDIAGWSQPADQTGGDYYDWMELPGGRVLFTIADAAGHGIGPALLVTACRAYFRALATHDDPLESITAQVDALLANDIPAGRFITAAVALLEPEQHRLILYSAGHAPLYLYTKERDGIEMFDADQPPLGVRLEADGQTKARIIAMKPGDMLVLVTDGFFECANSEGEQMGMENLGAAIRRHHALASDRLIGQLYAEVLSFAQGVPQGDDLTAVVIQRRA